MKDKIVLITGASSGIGFETARQLGELGAHIIMVCRDPERGEAARAQIITSATGPAPALFVADLSSQAEIRAVAAQIRSQYGRIDVLINNAGSIFGRREMSVDGIEKTFALNHLASFLLTRLLFDLVRASQDGRVITVASDIHSGSLDFGNLQGERHYNFMSAYNQSKLENILFTYELARRALPTGVTANTLSPGPSRTGFGDNLHGLYSLVPVVMKHIPFLFVAPSRAARTPVYLASSPAVAGITGRYFMQNRDLRTRPVSYDTEVARRLWEVSEELTGGRFQPAEPISLQMRVTDIGNLEAYRR